MQKKAIAEFHMGSMQAKKLEIFTNPEYQNPKEGVSGVSGVSGATSSAKSVAASSASMKAEQF